MPSLQLTISQYNSPVGVLTIVTSPSGICRLAFASEDSIATRAYLAKVFPGSTLTSNPGNNLVQEACTQLDAYFAGRRRAFDLLLDLHGTPFQKAVWAALQGIPYGTTCTYSDLARAIGRPQAVRATGQAIGKNPVGIIIPCHRVIGKGGRLVGFGGGLAVKERLLALEHNNHENLTKKQMADNYRR
ncbi:methylated-DNA--[protein]-cysteine S-methyltransferase [Moorella sp. Hama-1]|uniref:methylated-DNA--[protein]-cysteine S-methyltransferase n=1 Tax=Moorella sp. Hama-1 TaxID=2138101 RepID=UPI000D659848|nr:methylated-DNA--[protein]-cysteine S-methyltransferase [Moorella sp. Hama-1]MDN5362367.1 methylated-DNA-[protein]-cysteine S-methyltransferase [Moorella sp. (in: firmicutes)]BCV21516.1 methylated-DNA--protein-cysteine methyltransferase [Moorella sp. Hama-1]